MSITPLQLQVLIDAELENIRDVRVTNHIRRLLVEPTEISRPWDYGDDGEEFPCWSILDHTKSSTGIEYCEQGFGPSRPWSLVFLPGSTYMSLGMDSGWFFTFADAFFDSAAATDLPIWRAFKQEGEEKYPGLALTEEADWNTTWDIVYKLRAADPSGCYHCSNDIQVRLED
jgi:hypothetical protein